MILTVSQQNLNFWWIALGMGVVVIGVVIVLLSLLVAYVKDIDDRVDDAWETALKVAENTTAVIQLTTTVAATNDLKVELGRHVALLSGGG